LIICQDEVEGLLFNQIESEVTVLDTSHFIALQLKRISNGVGEA
jgi:hypothetical protein